MSLQTNDAPVITAVPATADPADAVFHLPDYPDALFDRLALLCGAGQAGQRVLDIATGTGSLARGFAHRGCFVAALDPADSLLDEAARRDRRAGVYVDYRTSGPYPLPFADRQLDLVCCGRAWDDFDRARVAEGILRALRPGGWVVLVGYAPLWSADGPVRACLEILRQRVPDWPGPRHAARLEWLDDLHQVGFAQVQGQILDLAPRFGHESLANALLAQPGLPARLDAESHKSLQASLRRLLLRDFPTEPQPVPHRLWLALGQG